MIVFLDESYEECDNGELRHAYAGFGLPNNKYRQFLAQFYQTKQHFLHPDRVMEDEERAEIRKQKVIISSGTTPEDCELKALKLFKFRSGDVDIQHNTTPGYYLAKALINALEDAGAVTFGVLSYPPNIQFLQDYDRIHMPMKCILERVNLWVKERHPDDCAVIVPDTVHDGIDRDTSRKIEAFLYRSREGQKMRHIVPNPFWVDSRTTAGSQVADIIAYVLMNAMRPYKKRKPITDIYRQILDMQFVSDDTKTHGIRWLNRHYTKKQQA